MVSTRSLVITAIGAATVIAAGAGSFMALRGNSAERAASAAPATAPAYAPVPPAQIGTQVEVERPSTGPAPLPAEPASRRTEPRDAPVASSPAPSTSAPARRATTPGGHESIPVSPPAASTAPAAVPAAPPPSDPPPPAAVVPATEAAPAQEASKPRFEELTVKEDAVIGIRLETALTSETAQVEDRVVARVSRDVAVEGRTAIPAGARLEGTVISVERGGKFKERARLGIRFTTLVLGESLRLPIQTESIFRDGESPTAEATSKIGASAVVGAILGAVIGGKKGAVIGSTAPLTVTVERQQ